MVTEPEEQEQAQEEAAAPAEAAEPPTASAEPTVPSEAPSEPATEAPSAAGEPPAGADRPSVDTRQETAAARSARPADAGRGRRRGRWGSRRKVCSFCVEHVDVIDYKDVGRLRRFLSDRGRIEPKRKLGTCAKHQRALSVALKRARHLALLPFTAEHIRQSGVTSPRQ
jgi:small subunit ribosomal protein S18